MIQTKRRGRLIVIEGCDGTGKTTVFHALQEVFPTYHYQVFPDRTTESGQKINDMLSGRLIIHDPKEKHLLFTDNRRERLEEMKDRISQGQTVVCDRYCYSGIAYSLAVNDPQDIDLAWCIQAEEGLIKPDVVIYLAASDNTRETRLNQRCTTKTGTVSLRETTEALSVQQKVSQVYQKLRHQQNSWMEIDADRSLEEVIADVIDLCRKPDTLQKLTYF